VKIRDSRLSEKALKKYVAGIGLEEQTA